MLPGVAVNMLCSEQNLTAADHILDPDSQDTGIIEQVGSCVKDSRFSSGRSPEC